MIVKLLTEHNLEFLSLKGGCRGSSESTHVRMPHCWKSHTLAHFHCCMIVMWVGLWSVIEVFPVNTHLLFALTAGNKQFRRT